MRSLATSTDRVERHPLGGLDRASPWLSIFEQTGMAVAVLDASFGFLRVNDLFAAAMGRNADFFLGRNYFELYPQAEVEALFRRVRDDGIPHCQTAQVFLRNISPTPGLARWNWSLTPLADGGMPGAGATCSLVLTMQDVSARLNAEARARRSEASIATRLKLVEMAAESSIDELLQTALDAAEALTGSTIGFFHFVDADQETLNLTAWSPHTLERMCTAEGKGSHYPISQAGVWADCLRQHQAIIHNDYPGLPNRAGLPAGHAAVRRELTVPVVLDGKIIAVVGVGNKEEDYSQEDLAAVSQLAELTIDVVARKRSELALAESGRRSRRLFESMTSGFALHEIILDAEGIPCDYRFLDVNPAFEAITGLARADVVGRRAREVMPQIEARWIERYGAVALSGDSDRFDDFTTDLQRHYRVTAYRPEPGQFAVILDDVTAIKRNEESLKQAAMVFENVHDGVTITDADGTILAVNRAFTSITGYSEHDAVGRKPDILKSGRHDAAFYAALWDALASRGFWQGEIWNRRKNGEIYPEWLTISAVANDCGEIERYIGVFTDISRVKDAKARAEFIACHDGLTHLPNRTPLGS